MKVPLKSIFFAEADRGWLLTICLGVALLAFFFSGLIHPSWVFVATAGLVLVFGAFLIIQRTRRLEELVSRYESDLAKRYSHEINNPLAIIVSSVEQGRRNGMTSKDFDRIEKSAMRIANLLRARAGRASQAIER